MGYIIKILTLAVVFAAYIGVFFYLPYWYGNKFFDEYRKEIISFKLSFAMAIAGLVCIFAIGLDEAAPALIVISIGFLAVGIYIFRKAYLICKSIPKSLLVALFQIMSAVGILAAALFFIAVASSKSTRKRKRK